MKKNLTNINQRRLWEFPRVLIVTIIVIMVSLTMVKAQTPFNSHNIVVLQMGDGSIVPNGVANPGFLLEYTTGGGYVTSHAIPTTGAGRLTLNPGITEGQITRSADFTQVVIPGYDAPLGTANVSTTTSLTVPRAIGSMDCSGAYSRPVSSSSFYSQGNFRGAASNGSDYWGSGFGTSNSINYFGSGTATNVSSTVANTRVVNIFNGQLYFSTQDIPMGIFAVGTGTPTTLIYCIRCMELVAMPAGGALLARRPRAGMQNISEYCRPHPWHA